MISLRSSLLSLQLYVGIVIALFFCSALIAFFVPSLFTGFDPYLQKLFTQASTLEGFDLFYFIFLNNLQAAFIGMIGGILFGLLPLGIVFLNGSILGYVAALVSAKEGFGAMWRLLPHGVFELPALFIALALGLRLGVESISVLLSLSGVRRKETFSLMLRTSLITFVCVILPLLLIAGIIETLLIDSGV